MKFNNKNKKAFSLAELSLILFIMGVIAVMFYRTLKPTDIAYNKLYFSAYDTLIDATREIQSYKAFNLREYCVDFSNLVNIIGASNCISLEDAANDQFILINGLQVPKGNLVLNYHNVDGFYDVSNDNNIVNQNQRFFPIMLQNGMQISFNFHTTNINQDNELMILIATIDVNGTDKPNRLGQDRIQFEIYPDGRRISPVGFLAEENDSLGFYVYKTYDTGNVQREIMSFDIDGRQQTMLSYQDAFCRTYVCSEFSRNSTPCRYNSQEQCTITPDDSNCANQPNYSCEMEFVKREGFYK